MISENIIRKNSSPKIASAISVTSKEKLLLSTVKTKYVGIKVITYWVPQIGYFFRKFISRGRLFSLIF